MYFFNALTAVAKIEKEWEGSGGEVQVKKYVKLVMVSVACLSAADHFSVPILGQKPQKITWQKKVEEIRGVISISNNASGLHCDAVYSTFSHYNMRRETVKTGGKSEDLQNKSVQCCQM